MIDTDAPQEPVAAEALADASEARSAEKPTPEKKRKRRGYIGEYFRWLRPFARSIISIYLLATVVSLLGLVLPRATMYIIDVVLPQKNGHMLHMVGLLVLAVIIVEESIDLWRNWWTSVLNAQVLFRLRQRLYEHLLHLPLHRLSALKTGGVTSRLSGDIDSVTGLVQMAVITPAVSVTRIIMVIAMLLWINWQLSIAAVLLLPPIVILNLLYIRRIRPIYRSMRKDRGEIDARVVETFGGIRVVRAFGREATESLRYAIQHHTVIRKRLLANLLEYVVWSGWGVMIPLAGLIIVWYGGTLVLAEKTTIGGIIAFQMYLMLLLMPVSSIVKSYGDMQQAMAAMERVFDLLHESTDKPDHPGSRAAPRRVEEIRFEHVDFAYHQGQPVLQDFTLDVPGGATIALVGPSGSGKTTVTNLVARFYDPTGGTIRLNGVDLRDLRLKSYRKLLGLVSQDVFLFDGTIAENIAYGRPAATDAEIEAAARRANAHEFVVRFPNGYNTLVGERGVRLSGGQAQRLSIARAILADPQILILDEATSNLDSESEQLIQASIAELLRGRTTFVIAHRLSTVVNADLIVVLEHGRIVEVGKHDDLMQVDSRYRDMVLRQRGDDIDDAVPAGAF